MADFEMTADAIETTATITEEVKTQTEAVAVTDAKTVANSPSFSADELKQINAVAEKIDIKDSSAIISYGASAQRKVSDFADGALESVRGKDMGETGKVLSQLLVELKTNGKESKGLLGGLFKKAQSEFEELKAQYSTTEANIDRLVGVLEGHEQQLIKDIAQLDALYNKNKLYFKEVSMYIAAGKIRLEKARNEELPELQAKANASNDPADIQEASDFADMIDRFDKKLYALELSRTVCLQSAPEIRMVQNSDTIMTEKIRTTIINVIPMWKTQMVLALNNYHTQEAIKAQDAVTEATNEMLKKNAELLHQSAVGAAAASEKAIVDIETLQNTNNQLITALDEIQKIQEDGKIARAEAEKELVKIEEELKTKLLKVAGNAGKTADQLKEERALEEAKA